MTPLVRRALLFLLVTGGATSIAASGRLSARLVADGAFSFAFIPVIQVAVFAILFRGRFAREALTDAAATFLLGNTPWLLWLIVFAAFTAIVPPRALGPWLPFLLGGFALPVAGAIVCDYHFFRVACGTPRSALADLALYRVVAWPVAAAWFVGVPIWTHEIPSLLRRVGL